MKYISRGINLDEEVWAVLEKARKIHGSYNKFLRTVLNAGGVFEAGDKVEVVNSASRTVKAGDAFKVASAGPAFVKPHNIHSGSHPIKGCTQCAALARK